MGVTVRRIDGDPAFAGICGALHMAGPEGQRLAAASGERDRARAEPFHGDARLRPGIGPRPRLDRAAARDGFGKGAFQQHLREHRLGVDIDALAEQDRSGGRENEGNE